MGVKRIEQHTDILLFIYTKKKVEIIEIEKEFDTSYQTLNSLLKEWMNSGILEREKLVGSYGGHAFKYFLTEYGIKFLKERAVKFAKSMGITNEDLK